MTASALLVGKNTRYRRFSFNNRGFIEGNVTFTLETVQDFLIKLDIKPLMHLLEISTFSLNNVIVRLTKIMNRADKNWAHF